MTRWRAVLGSTVMVVTTLLAVPAGTAGTAGTAGAAGTHRALVIVDTGSTTYQRVVTFSSDSITGLQALDLAGANPVVYSYAGQGGAVCRLFGVGRDAGPSCLGGADGDNRYWGYFRAPSGTSSFTYSRAGAGSVQVHDGDVEGWKFSTGQAPAWAPVPPLPTTTTTTRAATPPPAGGPNPSNPSQIPTLGGQPSPTATPGTNPGPPPSAADLLRIAAMLEAASTTTTSAPGPEAGAAANGATQVKGATTRRAGAVSKAGTDIVDDGSDWPVSLITFAAAVVAILGLGLYLRRSRHRPIP